ncbi:MAG: outer membrane protein assembly factor BamB family protein [Candidatus Aminicenantales bacterium]
MRRNGLFLIGVLFGFLCSCSPALSRKTSWPAGLVFPLVEAGRIAYEGKIRSPLRQAEGHLYLVTDKNMLYCFEAKERKLIWTHELEGPLVSSPVIGKESLFLVDGQGYLSGLNKSGQLLWKDRVKGATPTSLSMGRDMLIVGTEEGDVFAFEPSSGQLFWHFRGEGAFQAAPVFWEDWVICSSLAGKIFILNQKGQVVGTLAVGSPIAVAPLVDEDRLYVGAEDSWFYCFDLKRQKRKWRIELGGKILSPARADDRRVFVSASNCVLYCLDKKSGEIQWWRALPSRSPYELELGDGQIVVSSFSSTLLCLDRKSGEAVGTYDAGSELRSNPLWLEQHLFINLYDHETERGSLVVLQSKK